MMTLRFESNALGISYITETRGDDFGRKDKLDEVLEYFHLKSSELKMTASETVEDENKGSARCY